MSQCGQYVIANPNEGPAGAISTHFRLFIPALAAGGVPQAIPHGMQLLDNGIENAGSLIVACVHLDAVGLHAHNPLGIIGADADNIIIANYDAVNTAACTVEGMLIPNWQGYLAAGAGAPFRCYASENGNMLAAGNAVVGPWNLLDVDGPPPVFGISLAVEDATNGNWLRFDDPPMIPAPTLRNDDPANAIDYNVGGASTHTIQRYNPVGPLPGDVVLISGSAPTTLIEGGTAVVPHGLTVNGVGVIPDATWIIPVGGAAPGLALLEPQFVTRDLIDPVAVTYTNRNGGGAPLGDITFYALSMFLHSSVRY